MAFTATATWPARALPRDPDERPQRLQRVSVLRRLVGAPPRDAREADGDSAAVPGALGDPFEMQLEYVHRLDRAHGAEPLDGVLPDPAVEAVDLLVGQAGISFRHPHELAGVPYCEGEIRHQGCAPAMARLRVDQDRIDGVGLDLPLPPVPPRAPVPVWRAPALQHQPFHPALARLLSQLAELGPGSALERWRQRKPFAAPGDQAGELLAALAQGLPAQIYSAELEHVIRHERRWRVGQDLRRQLLPSDASLQHRERHRRAAGV